MTNSVKELVIQARNLADAMNSSKEFLITPFLNALAAVESEGDGWIEVKEGCEMPKDDFNVLVWVPNQTPRGGYWDLASYGDYVCEDEDCRPGDPNYVEGDDEGNRRGSGWHRQEETHGGPYDYVYIDLNGKVTHWRPLPAPPTQPTEKE